MKKIFSMLTLTVFLFSGSAFAESGFSCSEDKRPVDGGFSEVALLENENGSYDVEYTYQGPRDFTSETETLAEGLSCIVSENDGKITSCHKRALEESNSGFQSEEVLRRFVIDGGFGPEDASSESIEIAVYSPLIENEDGTHRSTFKFSPDDCEVLD